MRCEPLIEWPEHQTNLPLAEWMAKWLAIPFIIGSISVWLPSAKLLPICNNFTADLVIDSFI